MIIQIIIKELIIDLEELLNIWKNSSKTVKCDLDLDPQRIGFLDNVQPQELQM